MGDSEACLEVMYSALEEVSVVVPCGAKGHKYCVRLQARDTAILLQVSPYDKMSIYKIRSLLLLLKLPGSLN